MDNQKQQNEKDIKKYTKTEIFLGSIFFLTIDIICGILDFITFATISTIIQFIGMSIINIWAILKKDKESLKLGTQMLKYFFQVLPILPTLTTIFLISAILHNKKENSPITAKELQKN